MYSLEELTNSVMNALDELFNVNKLYSVVEYLGKDIFEYDVSLITFVPVLNSEYKITVNIGMSDNVTEITISYNCESHRLIDCNILDLQEMASLIMLTIKSTYTAFCHARGI